MVGQPAGLQTSLLLVVFLSMCDYFCWFPLFLWFRWCQQRSWHGCRWENEWSPCVRLWFGWCWWQTMEKTRYGNSMQQAAVDIMACVVANLPTCLDRCVTVFLCACLPAWQSQLSASKHAYLPDLLTNCLPVCVLAGMSFIADFLCCLLLCNSLHIWIPRLTVPSVYVGSDLSDYFNYGFTEDTWKMYCEKQRRVRMEVHMQKKISVKTRVSVWWKELFVKMWYSQNPYSALVGWSMRMEVSTVYL